MTHGTYEAYIGTELTDGCDCEPCRGAYKARMEAKKSFTYYRTNRPQAAPKLSAVQRQRSRERQRAYRARAS